MSAVEGQIQKYTPVEQAVSPTRLPLSLVLDMSPYILP
jgi:hypothetical protein